MPRESLVGQTLAGYTIRSLVGEGGTSVVYKADHAAHGTVALKVLREKLRNDRTAVARFIREAEYGTRVRHPNVVRTVEIGQVDSGMHFLATEWAEGEILDRYARRNSPLPPEEVAGIVRQIAAAVYASHLAGIVHRDLKPENVMYDPATRTVKLLDFGIAMDTAMSPDERLTRAGFFVGTLMYVAPEALSGALVTEAADQYSLATISYFLLTGCLPFTAKSQREMFAQLLSQPPIPLNRAREGLRFSPQLEGVVMKALASDPARRHASIVAFAEELAAAVHSTEAPPATGIFARLKQLLRRD